MARNSQFRYALAEPFVEMIKYPQIFFHSPFFCVYKGEHTKKEVSPMDDNAILDLYFARSEQAIAETDRKYAGA